jgi:hypothetical protein
MKRIIISIVALLVATSLASAQMTFGGGAHAGFSLSSFPKEIKDYYGLGIGFGGHADLNIMKFVTLRLNIDYHRFGSDKTKFAEAVVAACNAQRITIGGQAFQTPKTTFGGMNASIIGITVNGLGKLPTKSLATPYAIFGLGLHISTPSDPTVSYEGVGDITKELTELGILGKAEGSTKFGINFGAGSEFKIGQVKLFAEFKYVIIFTSGSSTGHFPITFGVTLGG